MDGTYPISQIKAGVEIPVEAAFSTIVDCRIVVDGGGGAEGEGHSL